MRLAAALMLALVTAALPARAQDVRALAETYADLPEVQAMWDDVFSPLWLSNQFRLGVPPEVEISNDQLDRIGVLLADQMEGLRPQMRAMMVETMAGAFSADEIAALVAFYQSKHGAAVMAKMPGFTTRYSAALAPMIQAAQQSVLPQISAIMAE
ncbi:DUF2059 domain-containing protein [Maritimibacter sp. UBA3975]|uniref:DUF2059 domain-containing protein n=1 Tax=Maritimibacter sp. UBA3975 TaxID=1946833 RepID=UPI0025C70AC7|nr:DUF2059 domain-containing protein [Maritimibacter sp. UBA3975]